MTRILVIDDDPGVLDTLTQLLESEQYEVCAAEDGQTGINQALQHLPDLIVSDVRMPVLDGYTVLKTLRNTPQTSTTPFIFLSANSEKEHIRYGMNLGADDYLTKPFDPNELLEVIGNRLSFRERIREKHETTLRLLRKNIMYSLPHEFRTPLMHILGYADMMIGSYDTLTPEDILEWAKAIQTAGQRLHKLAENYLICVQVELALSDPEHIDQWRNSIVPYPADVIETQARIIARSMEREADLALDLQNNAVCIAGEDLTKILQELIENAFKFSEPGTTVSIQARRLDRFYAISILDQGHGMTPEQIRLVDAYMQFDRTIYEQQGIGMGLIVAKRLTELHGGKLTIHSQPSQGTVVVVSFPV